jgi:hypothetical protein
MHTEIIRQFDDGRILIHTKVTGAFGECSVCGRDRPGLYMAGAGPLLCEEHADRLDDAGAAAEA